MEDVEAEVEEAVQRRRASPKAVVQWLVRHAAGLPLREASASEVEGLKRSHNAIWRRIQMFALELFEADRARLGRPRIIILDETSMNPSGEMAFLHAAINPDSRRILLLRLYPSRSTITVYAFMEQFIKRYGRPKLVCTEGGPRHHQALKWLRLRHKAISGGIQKLHGTLFLTLKQRIGRFRKYLPCRCGQGARTHVQNWLNLYAYHYNNVGVHRTLNATSPMEALS